MGDADGGLSEARLLHQEIIRQDAKLKCLIRQLPDVAVDESLLLRETRAAREIIADLSSRIENLSLATNRLSSRNQRDSVLAQVEEHRRELEAGRKDLAQASQRARKSMERDNRTNLFNSEDAIVRRTRRAEAEQQRENAESGERMAQLLERMNSRVGQSEDAIVDLVRSSETLGRTHEEYHNQAAFIQTGNKLLSKWERRELTDKILIAIALAFYFAAILYVLNKRVFSKLWFW